MTENLELTVSREPKALCCRKVEGVAVVLDISQTVTGRAVYKTLISGVASTGTSVFCKIRGVRGVIAERQSNAVKSDL